MDGITTWLEEAQRSENWRAVAIGFERDTAVERITEALRWYSCGVPAFREPAFAHLCGYADTRANFYAVALGLAHAVEATHPSLAKAVL
jgi:hypothetical protein